MSVSICIYTCGVSVNGAFRDEDGLALLLLCDPRVKSYAFDICSLLLCLALRPVELS